MVVGRYIGVPIDKLPNSYLRWLITQNFSKEILDVARKKLEESDYNDLFLNVSRHALDMFSIRFLDVWLNSQQKKIDEMGLASFIAQLADQAWKEGKDVSKRRHKDDGIVKELEGIKWVFNVNPQCPDYKDVITVMHSTDE